MVLAFNCTKNNATGFSSYELLFGRKPRLPIDIIFGKTQSTVCKRYPQYLKDWKQAMEDAYKIAAAKSGQSMAKGRQRYNERAFATDLKPGDRVLVKRLLDRGGPGKLRSFWEDDIYIVARRPDPGNAVYEVELESRPGRKRMLHRNLLLPCPFLPYKPKTNDLTMTNHRRTLQETPSQPNCVVHYEEEVSKDEGEDDLGLDPNQIAEFSRQLPEPAMDARQIETEIPIPIVEKESETVTDEIPASEKESETVTDEIPASEASGTVIRDAPIPPPSNVYAETKT